MANLAMTIWRGTFHDGEDTQGAHLKPALTWVLVLAAFALARLAMPFEATDTALVHRRIVDSLAASQMWGRQALIGSFEFPTLVTLCLLFADQLGKLLPITPAHLLVVGAQTWTFFYLLRIPSTGRGRVVTSVTFLAMATSREFQAIFFTNDPNWIATVPLASALYHLIRWQRHNALRDAIVLAVNCGLLVFCGPAGLVGALVLLCVGSLNLRRLPKLYDTQNMKGVNLLLWAPFGYCLVLLLLANWLIMRDAFFPLRKLAPALLPEALAAFPATLGETIMATPWICLGGLAIALCSVVGRPRVAAEGLAAGLIALILLDAVFGAGPVFIPGSSLFRLVLGIGAVLFPGLFLFELFDTPWQRNATILITGLTLFASIAFPNLPAQPEKDLRGEPPTVDEVTAAVDHYWARARVAVFGMQAPASFFDGQEKRFMARADFYESELVELAGREQVYLLIPPDDGRFYARQSRLAEIHAQGAAWLLLEKAWESGWQLWRCVIYDQPPEPES